MALRSITTRRIHGLASSPPYQMMLALPALSSSRVGAGILSTRRYKTGIQGSSHVVSALPSDPDSEITKSKFQELMLLAAEDKWDQEGNMFAPIDLASIPTTSCEADKMLRASEGYGLQERHRLVANALEVVLGSGGVKSQQPHGGTHCWLDLRGFLEWDDFECESKLFWDLYDLYGVLLTPGNVCGCPEPGWFRMHVASVPEETLATGFDRMERCLKAKQALHGNW